MYWYSKWIKFANIQVQVYIKEISDLKSQASSKIDKPNLCKCQWVQSSKKYKHFYNQV